MDLKRKLVGCLLVLFSSTGLLAACGAEDEDCETVEDCADGQVCTDDGVCEDEQVEEGCTDNAQCTEEGEVCNLDTGLCELEDKDPVYFTVLIKDVSEGASCGDTTWDFKSPGSQITYVRLENAETNEIAAYGTAIAANIEGESDFTDYEAVLNGEEPAMTDEAGKENYCVATEASTREDGTTPVSNAGFRQDSGVAIGCGGELYVTFKKDGNAIALDDSFTVRVGEYDGFCDSRFSGVDHYEVYLCEGDSEDVAELNCDTKLSGDEPLTGLQDTADVELPAAE